MNLDHINTETASTNSRIVSSVKGIFSQICSQILGLSLTLTRSDHWRWANANDWELPQRSTNGPQDRIQLQPLSLVLEAENFFISEIYLLHRFGDPHKGHIMDFGSRGKFENAVERVHVPSDGDDDDDAIEVRDPQQSRNPSLLPTGIATRCNLVPFIQTFQGLIWNQSCIKCTSNGGCRRDERSRKHWSLFAKLLFSVFTIFFIC